MLSRASCHEVLTKLSINLSSHWVIVFSSHQVVKPSISSSCRVAKPSSVKFLSRQQVIIVDDESVEFTIVVSFLPNSGSTQLCDKRTDKSSSRHVLLSTSPRAVKPSSRRQVIVVDDESVEFTIVASFLPNSESTRLCDKRTDDKSLSRRRALLSTSPRAVKPSSRQQVIVVDDESVEFTVVLFLPNSGSTRLCDKRTDKSLSRRVLLSTSPRAVKPSSRQQVIVVDDESVEFTVVLFLPNSGSTRLCDKRTDKSSSRRVLLSTSPRAVKPSSRQQVIVVDDELVEFTVVSFLPNSGSTRLCNERTDKSLSCRVLLSTSPRAVKPSSRQQVIVVDDESVEFTVVLFLPNSGSTRLCNERTDKSSSRRVKSPSPSSGESFSRQVIEPPSSPLSCRVLEPSNRIQVIRRKFLSTWKWSFQVQHWLSRQWAIAGMLRG